MGLIIFRNKAKPPYLLQLWHDKDLSFSKFEALNKVLCLHYLIDVSWRIRMKHWSGALNSKHVYQSINIYMEFRLKWRFFKLPVIFWDHIESEIYVKKYTVTISIVWINFHPNNVVLIFDIHDKYISFCLESWQVVLNIQVSNCFCRDQAFLTAHCKMAWNV